jgi:uncharacterized membrane protein
LVSNPRVNAIFSNNFTLNQIMKNLKLTLTFLFGAFMIFGGIIHFLKPEIYLPFIPAFLPQMAINYLAGILEMIIGIGVFIPKFRSIATLGILIMMLAFLPLHIIDVFKENPAIGSHQLALIRLPLQFVLIFWAWFIYKK